MITGKSFIITDGNITLDKDFLVLNSNSICRRYRNLHYREKNTRNTRISSRSSRKSAILYAHVEIKNKCSKI